MPDYRSMYFRLAGKVADAMELLADAQRECEEMAMGDDAPAIFASPPGASDTGDDAGEDARDEE